MKKTLRDYKRLLHLVCESRQAASGDKFLSSMLRASAWGQEVPIPRSRDFFAPTWARAAESRCSGVKKGSPGSQEAARSNVERSRVSQFKQESFGRIYNWKYIFDVLLGDLGLSGSTPFSKLDGRAIVGLNYFID